VGRQEAIQQNRKAEGEKQKEGQERTAEDKALSEIPDTALAEPVMLHAVQASLWDMFGERSPAQ
jgi:hypothetical protein